jgi:hypothetical protein
MNNLWYVCYIRFNLLCCQHSSNARSVAPAAQPMSHARSRSRSRTIYFSNMQSGKTETRATAFAHYLTTLEWETLPTNTPRYLENAVELLTASLTPVSSALPAEEVTADLKKFLEMALWIRYLDPFLMGVGSDLLSARGSQHSLQEVMEGCTSLEPNTCIRTQAPICEYACKYQYIHTPTSTNTYIRIQAATHTHTHTHLYIYIYIYIYTYIYIQARIHTYAYEHP